MFANNFITKAKCGGCALRDNKKFPCLHELQSPWIIKRSGSRVLIVIEQPRQQRGEAWLQGLLRGVEKYTGAQADMIVGLECETRLPTPDEQKEKNQGKGDDVETLPNPFYRIFRQCATLTPEILSSYEVIIPLGKALMAITETDDLITWEEFAESNFNQTYFYTGVNTNPRRRCYPMPSDIDFLWKDNFESKVFAQRQMHAIREYLGIGAPILEIKEFKYEVVQDPNEFLRQHMDNKCETGVDIETNSLNAFAANAKIKCVTLAFDTTTGYYLEFDQIDIALLSEFLKGRPQVYANGPFDYLWLWLAGVRNIEVTEDVVVLFKLLNTDRKKNSIKSLAWLVGYGGYDRELEDLKDEEGVLDYSLIDIDILAPYSCMDPVITLRLKQVGHELLKKQPVLKKPYATILAASPAFRDIEINGIHLNLDYLSDLHHKTRTQEVEIAQQIATDLKLDVEDISSPEKLGVALQRVAKLPALAKVKKGHYATSESVMLRWSKQGHTIADKILKYRKLSKQRQAFLGDPAGNITHHETLFGDTVEIEDESQQDEGLIKSIQPDGLIHPRYQVGLAKSGRMKCWGPNVSQFPSQGEEGRVFKPVLGLPGDDWYIMNMDFSGFQLRIIALKANEPTMIHAFTKLNGDLHSVTAQAVFCPKMSLQDFMAVKSQEPYKSYRFKAKCFVAGTIIATDRGDIPVEAFVPEVNTGKFTPELDGIKVLNSRGEFRTVVATIFDIAEATFEIEFFNGDTITVTGDHRFPIPRGEVIARDLSPGDELLYVSSPGIMGSAHIKSITERFGNTKVYCFHEPVREECLVVGRSGRRYASKQSTNFGLSFGLSANTLGVNLQDEWSEDDLETYLSLNNVTIVKDNKWLSAAQDIHGKFFGKYDRLMPWIESNRNRGIKYGYIDDVHTGYRRHLPFLQVLDFKPGNDENTRRFFNLLNVTTNTLAQSSEALHVYKAMALIHTALKTGNYRSRMFAMIHDYLGFYVHKSEVESVYRLAKTCSEDHNLLVPFVVEASIGKVWEQGEEITDANIGEIAARLGST